MKHTQTYFKNTALIMTILMASTAHTQSAQAQDNYPQLSGEVVVELQNEWGIDSDDSTLERNNIFLRTEVAPTLQLSENLSIDGVAVLEPILDFDPDENNSFEDEGVFIEELKVNYDHNNISAYAGKFNPGFGIAWDMGRGIWGEDFAEDYEITEKIGVGAAYTIADGAQGTHTLGATTFFADTTFLAESIFTSRGTTTKSDGGVSNTESFASFTLAAEGENILGQEGLYYKLGYRHLAKGDKDPATAKDEKGFVATLGHTLPLAEPVQIDLFAEYADIQNFEGGTDDNRYITASAVAHIHENWNLAVSYTAREINLQAGGKTNDDLVQISGGYDFGNGLTFEAGWRSAEESNVETDIIGALARYSFEF